MMETSLSSVLPDIKPEFDFFAFQKTIRDLHNTFSDSDIAKVKIWSSDYPKEMPICGYWIIPSERFAI